MPGFSIARDPPGRVRLAVLSRSSEITMEMHPPESLHGTHRIVLEPPHPTEPFWHRWLDLFARLSAGNAWERQVRRHIRELERMDDWMLRDMGLGRSEIETVVRHGHAAKRHPEDRS
jgi:uncharacterized protein YjiS (DUF1127 family)